MATQLNTKTSKVKNDKPAAPAAKPAPAPVTVAKAAPAAPTPITAKPTKARLVYEPTPEEIQTRAFEIYVSEGCKAGNDLENWLRAEKELRGQQGAR